MNIPSKLSHSIMVIHKFTMDADRDITLYLKYFFTMIYKPADLK